jgi:type IV pilus assembly protein PilM
MFNKEININLNFLQTRSPQLIGVDISPSSVKMVELSETGKDKNTYRIERYAIEPLPKDAMLDGNIVNLEAVGETLERAWNHLGTRLRNVAMALPAAAVITKKIIVPAGQREDDLAFQVEAEANQYIPFALDEVNLDFQLIGPAPNNPEEVEVLIAASHKEKVEDRIAAALTAGLKTVVMDVEPYAAQTAFELVERQLPNGGMDQIIAVVDIGSSVMGVNVLLNGQSVYMRDQPFAGNQLSEGIQRSFSLSPEEAETARRNEQLPGNYKADVLNPFCEALALEVARAMQFFFSSTQYTEVNYIFLAGGCAAIPGLDEIVAAHAQVSTLIANPFADMALSNRVRPKLLSVDAPSLLIACGLAMRSFDPS